jgi:hypothetical protein
MPWRSCAIAAATLVLAAGCSFGERMHAVGGRVTGADGKALPNVRVVFIAKGRSLTATGRTDAEGRYTLGTRQVAGGAPAGDYTVVAFDDDRGRDIDHPKPSRLAARYADPAASGLSARIEPGVGPIDLVLEAASSGDHSGVKE